MHIHIRKHTQIQHIYTHKHNTHTHNKDTQRQTYYIHTHTCTHLQINCRDEGRVYNSFGTSSSGMRGTGAVDFSTVYTIVSTLYTIHYSTYRVATINHSESQTEAIANDSAGQVLARPLFLKVKTKFHFAKSK